MFRLNLRRFYLDLCLLRLNLRRFRIRFLILFFKARNRLAACLPCLTKVAFYSQLVGRACAQLK